MTTNTVTLQTAHIVSLGDIEEAKASIKPFIRRTPLIKSMYLSQNITKGNVYLKLENMQFTGSFKFRGASNKINHLSDEQKAKRYYWRISRKSCTRCFDSKTIRY